MNVVCCSRDWRFKGYTVLKIQGKSLNHETYKQHDFDTKSDKLSQVHVYNANL